MIDDLFAIIANPKLRSALACLIDRKLKPAVDTYLAKRDAGKFLQLPSDPSPIHGPHDGRKFGISRVLMKELREHLQRTFQALRLAPLPMRGRVHIVEPLNPRPGKCTYLDGFAIHEVRNLDG
jgi:hypothetical protein